MGHGVTTWDCSLSNMDGYNPLVDYFEDLQSDLEIFSNLLINHGVHRIVDEGDSHGLRCDLRGPLSDGC